MTWENNLTHVEMRDLLALIRGVYSIKELWHILGEAEDNYKDREPLLADIWITEVDGYQLKNPVYLIAYREGDEWHVDEGILYDYEYTLEELVDTVTRTISSILTKHKQGVLDSYHREFAKGHFHEPIYHVLNIAPRIDSSREQIEKMLDNYCLYESHLGSIEAVRLALEIAKERTIKFKLPSGKLVEAWELNEMVEQGIDPTLA